MKILRSLLIASLVLGSTGAFLVPGAPAQTAGPSLTLNPSTGQAPSVTGSLSGSGWCYPIRELAVSGSGVAGSASVDVGGTLRGSFKVQGAAGASVVVTVGGTCASGPTSASATFTFAGAATPTSTSAPTSTSTPVPVSTATPTPTAAAQSPSATPTRTPTLTPPTTPAASQPLVATPTAAPSALWPVTRGTLRLPGCANPGAQVWLELVPATLAGTPKGGPVSVPAAAGDGPGAFSFEIPPMQTGQSFLVSARSSDPACPLADQAPTTWVAGSGRPVALAIAPSRKTFLGAWRPGPPTEGGDPRTGLRAGSLQPLLPIAASGQGDWAAEVELAGRLDRPYPFQWSTEYPGADAGVWQVSTQPFPQGAREDLLSPPGLVASASVDCVNCTFTVDLSVLAAPAGADAGPEAAGGGTGGGGTSSGGEGADEGSQARSAALWQGLADRASETLRLGGLVAEADAGPRARALSVGAPLPAAPATYFARVVPMGAGQPLASLSQPVSLTWLGDLPSGPGQPLKPLASVLTAPYGLTPTGDPTTCAGHWPSALAFASGIACASAIGDGDAVLVWGWSAWVDAPTPDGFRLYRQTWAGPVKVKDVSNGPAMTVVAFPYPQQPWPVDANASWLQKLDYQDQLNPCYTVRAVKQGAQGETESPDSNLVCLPLKTGLGQTGLKTIELAPSFEMWRYVEEWADQNSCAYGKNIDPAQFAVGYNYKNGDGDCDWYAEVHRGAAWFDLGQIPGPFLTATLRYQLVDTVYAGEGPLCLPGQACVAGPDAPVAADLSCATELMLGQEDWMGKDYGDQKHWLAGTSYANLPSLAGPNKTVEVNVTDAVRKWVAGQWANQGFVWGSADESMTHSGNRACLSGYSNARLVVQGFWD